jgi:hypothetical protein
LPSELFFLLSAASMGMTGCAVDLDPFDTSLTTLTTETGNATETSNATETGTATGDGDGGNYPVCADYGALYGECFGPSYVDMATMKCEMNLVAAYFFNFSCGPATEAIYVCMSRRRRSRWPAIDAVLAPSFKHAAQGA